VTGRDTLPTSELLWRQCHGYQSAKFVDRAVEVDPKKPVAVFWSTDRYALILLKNSPGKSSAFAYVEGNVEGSTSRCDGTATGSTRQTFLQLQSNTPFGFC
jgi:hypothetical protein